MSTKADSDLKLIKLISDTGLYCPRYERPRWWQWRKKRFLQWLDKHNLKYTLIER
jgi:hypothetical protein